MNGCTFEESGYSEIIFGLCHKHVSKSTSRKVEISLFETILRIRMVEERIATEYEKQEMRCPVHLSIGQEVAAGICLPLRKDDYVFSGHRNHTHFLANSSLNKMIAEIYGKETGCCLGKGARYI